MQEATKATKAKEAKEAKAKEAKMQEAKAKAQAFFAKSQQKKHNKNVAKISNAKEVVDIIYIKGVKVILNKHLKIKKSTLQDIKAKYNFDIQDTYTYNSNAVEYTEAISALQAYNYIIYSTEETKA